MKRLIPKEKIRKVIRKKVIWKKGIWKKSSEKSHLKKSHLKKKVLDAAKRTMMVVFFRDVLHGRLATPPWSIDGGWLNVNPCSSTTTEHLQEADWYFVLTGILCWHDAGCSGCWWLAIAGAGWCWMVLAWCMVSRLVVGISVGCVSDCVAWRWCWSVQSHRSWCARLRLRPARLSIHQWPTKCPIIWPNQYLRFNQDRNSLEYRIFLLEHFFSTKRKKLRVSWSCRRGVNDGDLNNSVVHCCCLVDILLLW